MINSNTVAFPKCTEGCDGIKYLGAGECEAICPNKFDKDGNPLPANSLEHAGYDATAEYCTNDKCIHYNRKCELFDICGGFEPRST